MKRDEIILLYTEIYKTFQKLQIAITDSNNIYSTYVENKDNTVAIHITKGKVIELLKEEMTCFKMKSINEITKILNNFHKTYYKILQDLPEEKVRSFFIYDKGLNNFYKEVTT